MITVKIENAYEDGHESTSEVQLVSPVGWPDDDWWQDNVFPHTGDGHGADGMGSCYTATIVGSMYAPHLVGLSHEWVD